jgi:hypothetical protein
MNMFAPKDDVHESTLKSAEEVLQFFWPAFVVENGMVLLARHAGSNPCPSGTLTDWESFINHTHVFDEFGNESGAVHQTTVSQAPQFDEIEITYDEQHPDFLAACRMGKTAARLWATKLKEEFPNERFRVYYTQYDNPIVRFHKVRENEAPWLPDEVIITAQGDLRNALVYDSQLTAFLVPTTEVRIH